MDWSRRTLLAATMTGAVGAARATPFPEKRWQRRLFLIFASSAEHAGFKQMRSQTRTPKFGARDLDLVEVTGDEVRVNREPVAAPTADDLRRIYEVPHHTLAVRLVGKDGTVKLARAGAVPITEVYALIDSMPMRRQEMHKRSQSEG
ncbi:MAG: DUF4174 domain-containing protein [Alphaproteobacteria bacterium]